MDERLEQKDKSFKELRVKVHEHNFIFRGSYPTTFIKFIKREEWYMKLKKEMKKHFCKDKTQNLRRKDRIQSGKMPITTFKT